MGLGRIVASAMLAFGVTSGALAQQAEAPPAKEYSQQFLVPGSWFHGVHGLAFNKDDQLFAGSIADNIAFFDARADAQWVEQCARFAAVHDEIEAMPMGMHTVLQEGDLLHVVMKVEEKAAVEAALRQPPKENK